MRLAFVATARGNVFMTEILEALAGELADAGIAAEVVSDRFPEPAADLVYAVIPHEFFATVPPGGWPTPEQLARTVALTTEQPGTVWCELAKDHARRCGAVMDISAVGVVEMQRSGIDAELLQLGYTRRWDATGGAPGHERPLDVLFMGSANRRREVHLSSYSDVLAPREVALMTPPVAPKTAAGPAFVTGRAKHELLASAHVLLSVRTQIPPYFEWVRALEAIANGAVLVCEHGAGHAPLVPGEHFVAGAPENLGHLADLLLREPERLRAIRERAYAFVRNELPLAPGALRLADVAASLAGAHAPSSPPAPVGAAPEPAPREPTRADHGWLPDFTDPAAEPQAAPDYEPQAVRRRLKGTTLELRAVRRELEATRIRAQGGDPDAIDVVAQTPAYDACAPRVTVCVPLYAHAAEVVETLDSLAAQDDDAFDVLVLDDASPDRSRAAVAEWADAHPWLPLRLLGRAVNAGLPAGRNALLRAARGELALMLDSDNVLYPQGIRRLRAALDADPAALFSYGVLSVRRDGAPDGLLSVAPWDPEALRADNPIDALALLRRAAVLDLGGYTEDERLHGWEDYDLWARIAERGAHGVHVASFVGIYRRSATSMLELTDLDQEAMRTLLAERYPGVMGPVK